MWEVYVLLSLKDNCRYIGSTNNLERRIREHNSGQVRSTKNRRPLKLLFKEKCLDSKDARKKERFFKTHKGYNYINKRLEDVNIN
ncbi:MAG: GIY-YIG nuclease family protein [Candidatus Moranbacteria bacterium]|nr:GIY-YIG nuclease family protein [Candidatus Moranbacteria bacterium]